MRDEQTGSWWQQVSGEAIQGPLKGRRLAGVVTDPEERARHLALGAAGPDAQVAAVLDEAAAPGPGPRPQRAAPAAAPLAQPRLLLRDPRPRQLADQLAPVSSSEAVYTPAVLGAVAGLAQVLLIAAAVIVGVGAAGLVGLLVWQ